MILSYSKLLLTAVLIGSFMQVTQGQNVNVQRNNTPFSFVFFTDIHLNRDPNNCFKGLEKAISEAKKMHVDFILTGGDNCDIDVLKDGNMAIELYSRFAEVMKKSPVPFYPAIGNHDRDWCVTKEDSLYNSGLFEKYTGRKSYYSFNHKGWHFIVLNTSNSIVDETQKDWLQNDLNNTGKYVPIVVVVHVPFLSVYYPALEGRYSGADTFSNFKEIWNMFKGKNLKLVLQGHQHLYEEIKVLDVQFITGGSVCANWWSGAFNGTKEGFLKVKIDKQNKLSWEYIDYGWLAD